MGLLVAWIAGGVPLAAQDLTQPFSHKIHLGAGGVTCVDCHVGATTSTQASDNLLPSPESCTRCHAAGRVMKPEKLTVSKFNHQLHTAIPGMGKLIAQAVRSGSYLAPAPEGLADTLESATGCEVCHRGMRASDQVTKAAFPAMADCLVCHSDIDPPFSCEKCHDEGAGLIPASHGPNFIDEHTEPGVDKASCAVCHGRRFTCRGCH